MQIHHQIHILKHIIITRARISTTKFKIIIYSNKHLRIELEKKLN